MPKVSSEYLDARRAQILSAAVTCFARDGFHRTTMQDIVQEAKLSPGAIYRYFASKEDMIAAIADERHAREVSLITKAIEDDGTQTGFERLIDGFHAILLDPEESQRRRLGVQLWAEALRDERIMKIMQEGIDGSREPLAEMIKRSQESGELSNGLDPMHSPEQ